MRIAVADLGTNSTRLLVADVTADGRLTQLERHTTVTRLGEGVDGSGRLLPEAMERVYSALARYREIAEAAGAQRRIAVATSAVRETENGPELAAHVRDRLGFDIRTIGGDEEARLTFLGATAGRTAAPDATPPAAPSAQTLVIDIGGGSTEFVSGRPGTPPAFHVSTRLGSVRQTERHLAHDPPRHDELEALADEACQIVAAAVPAEVRERIGSVIAVAGTPTSLAAIDQRLDPYDPERVDGYRLELAAAERILAQLALLPLDRRRAVTGLHADRAPTIVAGVAILAEALRLFGVREVEVSEADILDGAALDADW
jgi:exopolyphosphatase/guanosine-5'-triphosphate,3'-diphosphate pyrophosphatase